MIGLVLAGGGARGAYEVGVVRHLAERGFRPDLIAGTSIGALNGAVLASSRDFSVGARNLETLWRELGSSEIVRTAEAGGRFSFLDPSPVEELLRRFVKWKPIRTGIPLWVAVARVLDFAPFGNLILDAAIAAQTAEAVWVRLNTLRSLKEVHQFLLASAAIPIAFPARKIDGTTYVDGGLRDNVPLRALAQAGCTRAVVVHLSNGSAWQRVKFRDIEVLEIRPRLPIQLDSTPGIGWVRSLLDFRASTIEMLIERGAADARVVCDTIEHSVGARRSRLGAEQEMLDQVARLERPED